MKRSFLFCLIALALFASPVTAWAQAELKVKRDDTTVLTLRISENSLRFFSEAPAQLIAVLRDHGINCCAAQVRINEAAWKCCDGKFSIIASDARLQTVLAAAFNAPKVAQR